MHQQALDFVAAHAIGLPAASVLEIGSLDINGSVRPIFSATPRYHGLDLVAGPGVDEVADAAEWCPPDEPFDVVVSAEVLEHAPRWVDVLETAWAALAAGGTLLMTCATDPRPPHSAVDGWEVRDGEWYRNVPADEVRDLLRRWGCREWAIEVHRDRGDLYLRARRPEGSAPA